MISVEHQSACIGVYQRPIIPAGPKTQAGKKRSWLDAIRYGLPYEDAIAFPRHNNGVQSRGVGSRSPHRAAWNPSDNGFVPIA